MEKYGFIYIWYDCKHKRYYIGMHWGHEKDGYICSSPWMLKSFTHRPRDFKRRVLERIYTNRKDLYERELYWLSMIKDEELGKKYYNLKNISSPLWWIDENKSLSIKEKISIANKKRFENPEERLKISISKTGYKHSEKTKKQIRDAINKRVKEGTHNFQDKDFINRYSKMNLDKKSRKGKSCSNESKIKYSLSKQGNNNPMTGKSWYYNPQTNESKCYIRGTEPLGWLKGRKFSKEIENMYKLSNQFRKKIH